MNRSQSTAYSAAVGFVSEIVFSAIGMKPPGLASVAPAATIAIHGADATEPIFSIIAASFFGSSGLRIFVATQNSSSAASTMSRIATHVFGDDGVDDAAKLPSTNAARIPIETVAMNAPSQNQIPVRSGRSSRARARARRT